MAHRGHVWLGRLAIGAAWLLVVVAAARAQPSGPWPTRGELLYTTHCGACHTEQMHWREKKRAYDWATLKAQVARWQARANLDWNDAEVLDVARYLNETIYRYPQTSDQVSLARR
jgi:mono/diheme cytochrome c family protein